MYRASAGFALSWLLPPRWHSKSRGARLARSNPDSGPPARVPEAAVSNRPGRGVVPESWRTRLARWRLNWFPAYRATGARIEYIAADWREVRLRLPLTWRTRNYVGTIFGGSMSAALDPIYMVMLITLLGPAYEVWDKAATMRFLCPGRSTLRATFRIQAHELDAIRSAVAADGRHDQAFTVQLTDASGDVAASCEKLLSIRARPAPAAPPGLG
jgi:acyl-coenzyme A thioesterase PaaI-like protein